MKKTILNFILPVISFSSMVVGIEDLCYYTAWRIFIMVVAVMLFVLALVLIKRKEKLSLIIICFIASFVMGGALCSDYSSIKKTEKAKELWHDYLSEKRENQNLTDLEIEAIKNNNPFAQYKLARNYLNGDNGYDMDFYSAIDFAQRSADQGNAKAHDLLAAMYLAGRGCEPDTTRAIANGVQAIQEGLLDMSTLLFVLLYQNNNRLKERDSILVYNSYNAWKYIDSLATSLSDTTGSYKGEYPTLSSKDRIKCEQLSNEGYHIATEVLYSDALLRLDTINIYKYSSQLNDMDIIPDYPTMRSIFMCSIYGENYYPKSLTGKEMDSFIERSIKNQDFITLVSPSYFDSYRRYINKFSYYKYALAQYNRVNYLRKNQEDLYEPIISMVDNLDRLFDYSRNFLQESTQELAMEMKNRPLLFSSVKR